MKSFELLRAAATLILEGGWATGQDATGQAVDAADAEGNPVPLWVTGSTETGRAAPNPVAVRFSAYGAIVTALHQNGGRLEDPAAMWSLLAKRADEINGVAHGGNNFVHPLHQLNAKDGMEVGIILTFLGDCADEMESVKQAFEILRPVATIPTGTLMTVEEVQRLHNVHVDVAPMRALPRLDEPRPYPGVALGPHPSQPPAMLREVFDSVLAPNAKPLPPALTIKDVQDLHSTLAVPVVKVNRDPGAVAEPMQIARALKAAVEAPQAPLEPLPAQPWTKPVLPDGVEIIGMTEPVIAPKPYEPMLIPRKQVTVGQLREEFPKSFYSGPELNMKGMPNPFGGDDEQH